MSKSESSSGLEIMGLLVNRTHSASTIFVSASNFCSGDSVEYSTSSVVVPEDVGVMFLSESVRMRSLIRDMDETCASAACNTVSLVTVVHVTEVGVEVDGVFHEAC